MFKMKIYNEFEAASPNGSLRKITVENGEVFFFSEIKNAKFPVIDASGMFLSEEAMFSISVEGERIKLRLVNEEDADIIRLMVSASKKGAVLTSFKCGLDHKEAKESGMSLGKLFHTDYSVTTGL